MASFGAFPGCANAADRIATSSETTRRATTPIAVIGMACRLPGGIDSPESMWEALLRGADMVTEVPPERWDYDEYYDPEPAVPGRSVSKWGAFLDDVAGFDFEFFGIDEPDARAMDPQHRLLLETSWEAMERAGLTPQALADSPTGVFMGLTHHDYESVSSDFEAMEGPYGFRGNGFAMASGRIAYTLGLHGPALTLDAAGSSGLMAVHMACRSLNDGESDLALAGGAYVMLDPRRYVAASASGQLSPTGRCRAFDAAADGYVGGEGCAVVLLKRLPDALAHGDRILAVVRGTSANQDGRTADISTPSAPALAAVYRSALHAADIDAGSVGMIETHGLGSRAGDCVEYASLTELYGVDGPCALTSLKTNFGYAESASGVLGMVKAILSLQQGTVPRNLHFTRLPDDMGRTATKLFVPQENTQWPPAGENPRRAAVSSYGVSGTNVHVILEQAPDQAIGTAEHHGGPTDLEHHMAEVPLVFPLSSTSSQELGHAADRLVHWLDAHPEVNLRDVGYTLARRRAHRPVRTIVVAADRSALGEALREVAAEQGGYRAAVGNDDRGPVWVFSGARPQRAETGYELLTQEPVFAATIAKIEPVVLAQAGFSVTEQMRARETSGGIERSLPTLFAWQVALAAAMESYGVRPGAVIGHAEGEAAAAVVAGALSLEDGVRVICHRSRLMSGITGSGAMASVELPAKKVLSELTMRDIKDVVIAVVAAPETTVISGQAETLHGLLTDWAQRDIAVQEIEVEVASNSPQVDPIVTDLAESLAELNPLTPKVPFYSATGFDPREQPMCDSRYWVQNLRRTVRFAAAVRAALEDGYRVFAEMAPEPVLTRAVAQTADSLDIPMAMVTVLHRSGRLHRGLTGFLADLFGAGADVDFAVQYPDGALVDAPLPAWTHRRLWWNGDGQGPVREGPAVSVHPLLGPHVRLQEDPEHYVWQAQVGTDSQPWLAGYRIKDAAVLPGAALCEMTLATAQVALGDAAEVHDLQFEHAVLLAERTELGVSTSRISPQAAEFVVESNRGGEHTRHASAKMRFTTEAQPDGYDVSVLLAAHPHATLGSELRKGLDRRGVHLGAAFAGLGALHISTDTTGSVLAEIALPGKLRSQQGAYGVHPALLDACFQSVGASPHLQAAGDDVARLPLGARRVRRYGSLRGARYCYTRLTKVDTSQVEADLDVLDERGEVLLRVQGLVCGAGVSENSGNEQLLNERLLAVEWQQRELPDSALSGMQSLLLIDTAPIPNSIATAVQAALNGRGPQCTSMHWTHHDDHPVKASQLAEYLRSGGFDGVVLLTGAKTGDAVRSPQSGSDCVLALQRIADQVVRSRGQLPHLFVVTRSAQTVLPGDVANLEQGGLRGLVRVIAAEHPHLSVTHIDIDDLTHAGQLARQLLSSSEEDETAWRGGIWYVARMRPIPLRPQDRFAATVDHERDGMRLQVRTPGDLGSLELVSRQRTRPGLGQIEVAVAASSVNFADVLIAMGLFPSVSGDSPELGMDFAGVVTAVGPDVSDHRVGDRVGGFSPGGCWGTFVTCDARLAVSLPPTLTDRQAAAVATATVTAWHCLHDLAGICSSDRLLIHSATGGLGQAAIAVARLAGAEIFATAGSEQRRQVLRDMGIKHVYDSRSTDFADQIRRDTDGYGIDIVLNSLTGAAQRAGLGLLAVGGRFIEVGKRDVYANTHIGLYPFRRNLSFAFVDLALMSVSRPHLVGQLLRTVFRLVADGELPPAKHADYQLAHTADALRLMGSAQHTGKLVIDIPRVGHSAVVVPPEQVPVFRSDGAYLITGGLGSLGLFLAERMATAGCGRLVLTSRSQPTLKALETIELIRAMGCDVVVHCGDIAEPGTAQQLVTVATATGMPVRGVLHAAAVVEDAELANITEDILERNWQPKVLGAWNLHTATVAQPLDWFCSFTSVTAWTGVAGQGAYAAANSWLDTFTCWRRAQGLPATAIAWGAWGRIGGAGELADDAVIAPDEGAYALEALLRHDLPCPGYAPILGATWLSAFAQRSPFAEAFRHAGEGRADTGTLRAELNNLPRAEWPARLRRLIAEQIGLILRRSIDPDRPLAEYGVDSLGALELRTRIEAETGIRLVPNDLAAGTIRGLAELLCKKMAPVEAG